MNKILLVKILNLFFVGILLGFIYIYYTEVQPAKKQAHCAKSTTQSVLGVTSSEDPYGLYQQLYKNCLSRS